MADETTAPVRASCDNCEFEAPGGSDEWQTVTHPPLGTLTQCPECGSTNVYHRG